MILASDLKFPVRGTKVHYTEPYTGKVENGVIQTYRPPNSGLVTDITEVFVVYESSCGRQWHKYQDFTAQLTKLESLTMGWKLKLNWDMEKLIKQAKNYRYDYRDS